MAVKEFLDAFDKKNKEEAAMAAAPVSAGVAPATPTMQVPLTIPQEQRSGGFNPREGSGFSPETRVELDSLMKQPQGMDAYDPGLQAPDERGSIWKNPYNGNQPIPMPIRAPEDLIEPAQTDVLAAAPAVQAPQGVLSPEDRTRIEGRLAQTNADIVASGETVPSLGADAPKEGFMSRLVGGLGEQFTQPAPYTPQGGGAEVETAFGATPTQPTLFREGLSALSELNKTPLTSPDSFQAETPSYGASDIPVPPVVEMATPESVANLSVNGTDAVTPEATAEAGQAAPIAVAPQVPQVGSGGMITRDLTGESFIRGSRAAATPEEVAAFNKMSLAANTEAAVTPQTPAEENLDPYRYGRGMVQRNDTGRAIIDGVEATPEQVALFNSTQAERDKAGDLADRKRYEARLENERLNPTPAPSAPAPSAPAPRAPRRQSIQERDSIEKSRAEKLRKEGKRNIDAQMREFNREPRSTRARAAEKARLQRELNASIKEDRDYNRATTEANFANETAAYNRNTLTAAQRAADDGKVSIRDQIALRDEARGVQETQLAETQSYNNSLAAARSLVRDVGNIEDVAGTAKAQADSALTTGPGGLVMSILPGSKASDLRASLDTLTADSAFSALSEMRASSKTGGALGAISERELTLLGAAKRSLSANQSDEQLIKNINTYVEIRNRMMADAKLRFAQDYGVERANEAFGQSQGGASSIKNDRNVSSDAATEAFISKYNAK